mmetsp:Transcript_3321/g.4848  ORF Transcript_3321/g.4848 Transcript_3321/m.4848 type:complete len:263 (-) Transcript_3321:1686-2474(-)
MVTNQSKASCEQFSPLSSDNWASKIRKEISDISDSHSSLIARNRCIPPRKISVAWSIRHAFHEKGSSSPRLTNPADRQQKKILLQTHASAGSGRRRTNAAAEERARNADIESTSRTIEIPKFKSRYLAPSSNIMTKTHTKTEIVVQQNARANNVENQQEHIHCCPGGKNDRQNHTHKIDGEAQEPPLYKVITARPPTAMNIAHAVAKVHRAPHPEHHCTHFFNPLPILDGQVPNTSKIQGGCSPCPKFVTGSTTLMQGYRHT